MKIIYVIIFIWLIAYSNSLLVRQLFPANTPEPKPNSNDITSQSELKRQLSLSSSNPMKDLAHENLSHR